MTALATCASQENSPVLSTVMHKGRTQTSVGTRAQVLVGEASLTCRCSYLDTGRQDCEALTPSFFVRSRHPFLSRSFCSCLKSDEIRVAILARGTLFVLEPDDL